MKKLLALFLILVMAAPSWATTTVFQSGTYGNVYAVKISPYSTNQHSTEDAYMNFTADEPMLIESNTSSIPTSATVSSATLSIKLYEAGCATGGETVELKVIENPDNSGLFPEAGSSGDFYNQDATWADKDFGVTEWSSAEGTGFGDVDDNTAVDTASVPQCLSFQFYDFDVTTEVSDWIANPSHNSGWYLDCTDACSIAVRGSYYTTIADRPKLTVVYTTTGGEASTRRTLILN